MTSLNHYVSKFFEVEPGSPLFIKIYGDSLKYLTGTISASELHRRLKKCSKKSIKDFRLKLVNEGYYLLNVKMWLIHSVANIRSRKWNTQIELRLMGIMKNDREYLPLFTKDTELKTQVKKILFQLGGKLKIPTITQLKSLLVEVMALAEVKLKPLISNLIWTKLKFLIDCGSLDMESVRGDFKAKIIQTFYQQAPYRKTSVLHWVMSMIKPLKNHAINLINFYTTQKRVRMIEEDGVYKTVEVSLNGADDENNNYLNDGSKTVAEIELRLTAQQLIKRYGLTAKRIKAFKLLSGTYDEGFTQWLRSNDFISANSHYDNTDLQEQIRNRSFLRLVSKYLGLKWHHFKKLMLRIKQNLSEEGGVSYDECITYRQSVGSIRYAS